MSEEHWIKMDDGRVFPDEEEMLATLLKDGILFASSRKYLDERNTVQKETIVLFVNCSDTFAWGCADGEELPISELPEMFKLYEKNGHNGVTQWVCVKRNEQPQAPVTACLKRDNFWNEALEKLPPNHYDIYIASKRMKNER